MNQNLPNALHKLKYDRFARQYYAYATPCETLALYKFGYILLHDAYCWAMKARTMGESNPRWVYFYKPVWLK